MINFDKKISNTSLNFIIYLQIFLWVISFSSIFFFEFCDSQSLLSNCDYAQFIIAFFGAIIVNIIIQIILFKITKSDKYQKFEQNNKTNKIKGHAEIILAPIIAIFYFMIFYIPLSFQGHSKKELFWSSFAIFVSLLLDGIRRLKK